ncbi:MAG: retroviral-like aspartic protease family protein [Prevotellaceae bacterium]|nr:retroviral-like aspartic protease family protein [Prevotellaceae bacterium]
MGKQLLVMPFIKGVKGGETAFLSLVLDTGAEKTCINEKSALRLGFDLDAIKPTATFYSVTSTCTLKVVHLHTFELLGRKEKNFPVFVHAFPPEFDMVHGVVGMDFLARLHKLKINFDAHEIEVP